jgi:hypothetical protein
MSEFDELNGKIGYLITSGQIEESYGVEMIQLLAKVEEEQDEVVKAYRVLLLDTQDQLNTLQEQVRG